MHVLVHLLLALTRMEPRWRTFALKGTEARIWRTFTFWTDCWIPGFKPLSSMTQIQIPQHELGLLVSAYATPEGWNWNLLGQLRPPHVCYVIAAVNPPNPEKQMVVLTF
ncbi:hypothetical protein AAZX31_11G231600 [Glycine max]